MSRCEDCKNYKGDCGHHHKDSNGHINYDCPGESEYDGVIGDTPICFEPSDEFKNRRREEKIKYIIGAFDKDIIKAAYERVWNESIG